MGQSMQASSCSLLTLAAMVSYGAAGALLLQLLPRHGAQWVSEVGRPLQAAHPPHRRQQCWLSVNFEDYGVERCHQHACLSHIRVITQPRQPAGGHAAVFRCREGVLGPHRTPHCFPQI